MFNFFQSIADFFSTVVDFVAGAIEHLLLVVRMIASGFVSIGLVIVYLPDIIQAVALAFIAYCVVINLINKGG